MKSRLVVLLLALCAPLADAQAIRIVHQPADCNLARSAFDNPFSDSRGWSMPRYAWHGFYAGLTAVSAEGLHQVTGLSRAITYPLTSGLIGFAPHARALYMEHRRGVQMTINLRDWLSDGVIRGAPNVVRTKHRAAASIAYAGLYAIAPRCYASP